MYAIMKEVPRRIEWVGVEVSPLREVLGSNLSWDIGRRD
jgi:hypothetical protein